MKGSLGNLRSLAAAAAAVGALLIPSAGRSVPPSSQPPPPLDAAGDDIFLLTTSVAPNVVLLMDNSESMNHIEWHPAFDPNQAAYGCDGNGLNCCEDFDPNTVYTFSSDSNESHCGNGPLKIWAPNDPTLWDGRYLNWYFSDEATPYQNEIKLAKAPNAGCNKAGGSSPFGEKYRRTRFEASKQVLLDLLCVAESKNVRFAFAEFRDAADAAGEDPNGGFLSEDLGRSNPNHAAELEAAIKNSTVADKTPLAESLFQIYTYWMARDVNDMPVGEDGVTKFPIYQFDKFGNWESNSSQWIDDAMLFSCEKAFVVLVSDGLPSRDDFDTDPADTAAGFGDFVDLIGDYNADGEVEEPGDADETSWYLDDIAKYMFEKDFRPVDFGGDQTIDTYTIGFATDATTDAFLQKTADVGNGLFLHARDGDELAQALIVALNDIVEKAASFTAASVPSARTIDGGDFYQSYFFPSGKSAFWEGHIRAWHITADGDVEDKNGTCALEDPTNGECNSGPFKSSAEYFWDAFEEVPVPASRDLHTSKVISGTPTMVPFEVGDKTLMDPQTLVAADLGIAPFTAPPDPAPNSAQYPIRGSAALNEEGLSDEVVAFLTGCAFGTGAPVDVATPVACVERPATFGDVFHSNPVVVRQPRPPRLGDGFEAFMNAYAARTRVLYAGTNGGFLEAVHAGTWQAGATPPTYDSGTGAELFGFMPWEPRNNIKRIPIGSPLTRKHFVDGSPQVANVWIHPTPTTASQNSNGSEWRTALVGGLREGGRHFYALDVTNPDGIAGPGGATLPYPGYLWEFPSEADPDGDLAFMGETWGQPIITRVKVQNALDLTGGVYERWVAIVTAGYTEVSDPNPVDVTGKAAATYDVTETAGRAIYVIDIKTGKVLAEQRYTPLALDARKDMKYSLVTTPAVFDFNGDRYADVIYVGDLGGQVFKWVIHPVGEDRVNDMTGLRTQPNWTFSEFFDADVATISGDDYFKNLYFPAAGGRDGSKLWLAFGSGERRSLPYEGESGNDAENNRFYVVRDNDPMGLGVTPATITESDLADASGSGSGVTLTTEKGYFFRVGDGEKFVTNVEIFAGKVLAASFVPTPNADPCISRGDAALYVFNLRNGEGHFTDGSNNPVRAVAIGVGLPTDPKTSVGPGGTQNRVYIEKSGADLESLEADDIDVGGRFLYWRERP